MESIDTYYRILGISSSATIDEIKLAYRKKAKQLHPDKNKSLDAHEQFVSLTEAYDFLKLYKSGKIKPAQSNDAYSEWLKQDRERARQHAKKYAEMRYEAFTKTDQYKNTQAINTIAGHLYFFSSILLILSPLWGFIYNEWTGFFVGLFAAFISVQYWAGIFKEKIPIDLELFSKSVIHIFKTARFKYTLILLLNVWILFRYTFNTQITLLSLALIAAMLYFSAFIIFYFKFEAIKKISRTAILLCLIPSIFNSFFLTNFTFSSNPKNESYSFTFNKAVYGRHSNRHLEDISYIELPNNMYENYYWFRMFFDFDAMKNTNEITYTFEDGLLGFRVLKNYTFKK